MTDDQKTMVRQAAREAIREWLVLIGVDASEGFRTYPQAAAGLGTGEHGRKGCGHHHRCDGGADGAVDRCAGCFSFAVVASVKDSNVLLRAGG